MADGEVIKEFLALIGFKVDVSGAKRADETMDRAARAAAKREEARRKKQAEGIRETIKVVAELATAMVAMAGTTVAAVVKSTDSLENLYWASQRLRTGVTSIKAFGFGVSQMGGNAADARASLENLGDFLRTSPGGARFLATLGVQADETSDKMEVAEKLAERFRTMAARGPQGMAQARAYAGVLGIDNKTLDALIRGVGQFSGQYRQMAKETGTDLEAGAKASMEFARQIRELQTRLELLWIRVLLKIQTALGGDGFKRLSRTVVAVFEAAAVAGERLVMWLGKLDAATGGWSTKLLVLMAILGPLLLLLDPIAVGVLAVAGAFATLADDFATWKAGGESLFNWSAWSGQIENLMGALRDLGAAFGDLGDALAELRTAGGPALEWLGNVLAYLASAAIVGAVEILAQAVRGIAWDLKIIAQLLNGDFGGAWKTFTSGALGALDAVRTLVRGLAGDVADLWYKITHKGQARPVASPDAVPADYRPASSIAERRAQGRARLGAAGTRLTGSPAGGAAAAVNDNAQAGAAAGGAAKAAYDYFVSKGWTPQQAAGIVANLQAESGLDTKASGDSGLARGIAQWHPDRQAAFKGLYGKDIADAKLSEQLGFVQYELTRGVRRAAGERLRQEATAYGAGAVVSSEYESPRDKVGEMAKRGAAAEAMFNNAALTGAAPTHVNINQKTDIHVSGEGAADTGRAVAREQDRVNGNMVRNTKSALN